jgi:hypothetical protein
MKEWSPILFSHGLGDGYPRAPCVLNLPGGSRPTRKKLKNAKLRILYRFIVRISISLVPSMYLLQGRCEEPNFTLEDPTDL